MPGHLARRRASRFCPGMTTARGVLKRLCAIGKTPLLTASPCNRPSGFRGGWRENREVGQDSLFCAAHHAHPGNRHKIGLSLHSVIKLDWRRAIVTSTLDRVAGAEREDLKVSPEGIQGLGACASREFAHDDAPPGRSHSRRDGDGDDRRRGQTAQCIGARYQPPGQIHREVARYPILSAPEWPLFPDLRSTQYFR